MAQSKMHTISIRALVGIVTVAVLALLAGGFALGYGFSRSVADDVGPGLDALDQSQGRMLINRFGELSARMMQLEAEAVELATRIGMIKDFDTRATFDGVGGKQRTRMAKTPPGAPAGGPMLRPQAPDGEGGATPDPLSQELSRLERHIGRLAGSLEQLDALATNYSLAYMSFPGRSPLPEVQFTSSFGNRIDPFRRRLAFHSGVDYPAPKGTPIHASAGGRVIFSGYRSEYGRTVEIEHGGGLVTRYAHASKLHVKVGQVVMPGQKIADVGSTGRSTGPHLHFEILQDGRFADPARYLARF
jgi:murein DD-endopeptidase MepM/ murein hydrolase activator NlpD